MLAPIVLKTAVEAGHDPLQVGFLTALSSAFGYLTPAAQPAFTIIFASGYLKTADFFKIGIRMGVLSLAVLLLMAEGNLNKQIGYSLGLSERTVKMHRAALLKALGVATTADAIRVAVEAGF